MHHPSRALLSATAFCFCLFATAQENAITIRFIGNCGLHLTDGQLDVYTDFPYKSGAFNYMEYPASEIDSIRPNATHLFTHRHPDHYQKKLVKRLSGALYGPWKVKKKRSADLTLPKYTEADFKVEAFRTKHSLAKHHFSYLITWHGKRIYISGDTEDIPEMRALQNIDVAFVCMNLPYTMTVDAAASGVLAFKPKVVYPYHYRGKEGMSDVAHFKQLVHDGDKGIEVRLVDWYKE